MSDDGTENDAEVDGVVGARKVRKRSEIPKTAAQEGVAGMTRPSCGQKALRQLAPVGLGVSRSHSLATHHGDFAYRAYHIVRYGDTIHRRRHVSTAVR